MYLDDAHIFILTDERRNMYEDAEKALSDLANKVIYGDPAGINFAEYERRFLALTNLMVYYETKSLRKWNTWMVTFTALMAAATVILAVVAYLK